MIIEKLKEYDFKVGTKFVGNGNKAEMQVVKIENNHSNTNKSVIFKDLKTGKLHSYGLQALIRCNVSIIK